MRALLSRHLPTLDTTTPVGAHACTTWRGWTWHHVTCPCRRLPLGLVPYSGKAIPGDSLTTYTGARWSIYSPHSWFLEVWVRGRFVGLAR